jgi:hypothetical protein
MCGHDTVNSVKSLHMSRGPQQCAQQRARESLAKMSNAGGVAGSQTW